MQLCSDVFVLMQWNQTSLICEKKHRDHFWFDLTHAKNPSFAEVNGFHPKAIVFVSEKRCAFAAGKLIVEMDVDSKKQRWGPGLRRCQSTNRIDQ